MTSRYSKDCTMPEAMLGEPAGDLEVAVDDGLPAGQLADDYTTDTSYAPEDSYATDRMDTSFDDTGGEVVV